MAPRNPLDPSLPVWRSLDGQVLACIEKIRVLNDNLHELRELVQEALEDGVLIGCDEKQLRDAMLAVIDAAQTGYQN